MDVPRIRIGNQTSADAPARLPFDFALRHGFDAFEWFSDRGRGGGPSEPAHPSRRHAMPGPATDTEGLFPRAFDLPEAEVLFYLAFFPAAAADGRRCPRPAL